jgi:hypothetical protein
MKSFATVSIYDCFWAITHFYALFNDVGWVEIARQYH